MFNSDIEQRKQRSQNNRKNEHNRDKTKKNFTGSYTEVNQESLSTVINGHHIEIQISLRWPNFLTNSVIDKTKEIFLLPTDTVPQFL